MITGVLTNSYVDSETFDSDPIKTMDDYIFMEQLDPALNTRREVRLNYNIANFVD